jgi:hypothetical protein
VGVEDVVAPELLGHPQAVVGRLLQLHLLATDDADAVSGSQFLTICESSGNNHLEIVHSK